MEEEPASENDTEREERMPEGTEATSGEAGTGRKKIQVILPEELDRRLDAVAGQARVTKSELIRQILSAALEEAS
jgi:Ribbon-helix-helix protein, copG family